MYSFSAKKYPSNQHIYICEWNAALINTRTLLPTRSIVAGDDRGGSDSSLSFVGGSVLEFKGLQSEPLPDLSTTQSASTA
jgi:hypothetical protein